MKMKRQYWIGADLDELEAIERELESSGTIHSLHRMVSFCRHTCRNAANGEHMLLDYWYTC